MKDAPGLADYAAFYQHAAATGFFFGDPRAAKAQPGRERGMTLMYKKMAEAGIPYSSQLRIGFKGDGFMAKIMEKTSITIQTEVTEVSNRNSGREPFRSAGRHQDQEELKKATMLRGDMVAFVPERSLAGRISRLLIWRVSGPLKSAHRGGRQSPGRPHSRRHPPRDPRSRLMQKRCRAVADDSWAFWRVFRVCPAAALTISCLGTDKN